MRNQGQRNAARATIPARVFGRLLGGFLGAGGLVMIGLLGGCDINKPVMPTYDTSLSIPLGVERVEVMEMLEDETFLVVNGDGSLGFSMEGAPDTLDFDFDLVADISSQTVSEGLGNFELTNTDPLTDSFPLAEIWPPSTGMSGVPALVPPFPLDLASNEQDLPDIESATLAEGSAAITVTNGLPVPVSAAAGPDQMVLELIDPVTGSSFATFVFPAIAPGGSNTQTADLAGTELPGRVAVELRGGSPGSSGSLVTVNGSDSLDILAEFTGLLFSAADAVVEAQTFQTSFDTELPADFEITGAVIGEGSVDISVTNDMALPCTALLRWPVLENMAGQVLTSSFDLAAGQTLARTIDFSDHILESDGAPLTALTATVDITTDDSGGSPVSLSAGDGLTVDISSGAITFASVTGIVPAYVLELDPSEEDIDLPDELDGISFTSTTMVLSMTNSAGLPGDLDLTLTGTSATGQVRTLNVQQIIAPAIDRAPVTTPIILDENNSEIVDFLNNLPESITLSGQVAVGGDGTVGTVRADDHAVISWELSAPLEIIIDGSVIEGDSHQVDLDEDLRDMIRDHALGASIQAEILNHLPVGVELRIFAGISEATLASAPQLVIGPLTVESAQVDPATHTVSEAVISRPVVQLDGEQARIFSLPNLLTMVEVTLPSTEGNPVRMMSTDFLEVRGIVQVDVHVNDEW